MKKDNPHHNPLPLKDAIRNQASSETLAPEQVNDLMAMQHAVLDDKPQPVRRFPYWLSAVAACLVLVVSLFVWNTSNEQYAREIALEVVENHLKLKPMDVKTQSMTEIQSFFTQLDFSPAQSSLLENQFALPEQLMIGGRYCSVKGVTAAQLRYRGTDDQLRTFYEVGYDEDKFGRMPDIDKGETPQEIIVKGLKVTMWVEKGLLMALVKDM